MSRPSIAVAAAVALGFVAPRALAQEVLKPETEAQRVEKRTSQDIRCTPGAALRVQVLITRVQDAKKEASLPYTFLISARPSQSCPVSHVRMRMGVDTPVPTAVTPAPTPVSDESGKVAQRSVQYKTVGTNIDCSAEDLGDGRYKLFLTVENSSALPGNKAAGDLAEYPLFRRFDMSLDPILRDGQKAETVTSTDPVTGEIVKIDVSVNVVK